MTTLEFDQVNFTSTSTLPNYHPAYSSATRVLSDEGVKALKSIVDKHSHLAKANPRQAAALRGLAYKSRFIRDMMTHKTFLDYVSKMAGKPLCIHSFGMNA
jgi:hypothetical protein